MKLPELPSLPDLDDDFFEEKPKKSKPAKKEPKKIMKANRDPIIPKTQYDSEGNPILAIPDLDDVNLNGEIDRFFSQFGKKEEE